METRFWRVCKIPQHVKTIFDGYWIWLLSMEKPNYDILENTFSLAMTKKNS